MRRIHGLNLPSLAGFMVSTRRPMPMSVNASSTRAPSSRKPMWTGSMPMTLVKYTVKKNAWIMKVMSLARSPAA